MSSIRFAIQGATALAGEDLRPIDAATILVRDGAIEAVGGEQEVPVPEDMDRVDASGLTLVPGFIDAHVHIGLVDPGEVLSRGVTTVRDLAWPPQEIWPLAHASRDESFAGPLVLAAGQMLTAEGGYPTRAAWAPPDTGREVVGTGAAEAAVAEQADAGATIIKVALNPPAGPTLDDHTLAAIVKAAHARGFKVTGHVHGLDELNKAIAAGVDELAHMLMSPEHLPDGTIAALVDHGVTIVPTLSIFFAGAQDIAIENLSRFVAAGGRVVYGTDLGNEGPKPGIDAREIDALQRAGMSARSIIASATVDSARWLGLDETGVLEVGMAADIVGVDGDPLSDPSALTRVQMVWRSGLRAL